MFAVGRATENCVLEVSADFVCGAGHAAAVGMVVSVKAGEQIFDLDYSVCGKFLENVVNSSNPLFRHIMPYILQKLSIVNLSLLLAKSFLYRPNLLRGQENPK